MNEDQKILEFFKFEHLPPSLQRVSKPYCELALHVFTNLPESAEKTFALRKLLESKDCAVRSAL